ncbi:hypothetical protein B0H19DRAFT_1074734 [Mycena capillaripes]|nr:hypothetical protein B0H19DRAFT_1074734 [Mycena capillaripes]
MLLDPIYAVLIICLALSNLGRFQRAVRWVLKYLTRPRYSQPTLATELPEIPFSWNFWPDGRFQSVVSAMQMANTHKLATNWILETVLSRGSPGALTWQRGHELRRRCAGVIECHTDACSMQLAPALRAIDRYNQLQHPCPICGEALAQIACGIESSLFRFRGGARFIHKGTHNHSIFTHSTQQQRNGSLEFVPYAPKYMMDFVDESVDTSSRKSEDTGSNNESTASWHGIHYGSAHVDENELDDEEKWEIDGDPEAEQDEDNEDELDSD